MYFEDRQQNFFFKLQKEQNQELSRCIPWEDFDPQPTREKIEVCEKNDREKTLDKYKLLWNSRQNKDDSNFEIIFHSETFSDIDIICDGWKISKCYFKDCKFEGLVDFSNSIFKEFSFINSTFEENVILRNISFIKPPLSLLMDCTLKRDLVLANNNFQNKSLLFCRTSFGGAIDLHGLTADLIVFGDSTFKNNFNFGRMLNNTSSVKEVEFYNSSFEQEATFHTCYTKINRILIQNSIFKNRVFFKSDLCEIALSKSEFEKSVYFESSNDKKIHKSKQKNSIKKLDFDGATFQNLAFFDANFDTLPDFSRANFFKQPSIERYEKWNESKENVDRALNEKNAEAKFRFLKDYFAKKNNHQKELEYFELEMRAKEKELKGLKYFEKLPYLLYHHLSNYGNSVMRPLWWLFVSWISFGNIFKTNYNIESPYLASFARTIFPLISSEKVFLIKADLEKLANLNLLIFQSSVNLTLLFLLFLGLRNKFKIK